MTIKRVFSLLLAGAMLFALTGCAGFTPSAGTTDLTPDTPGGSPAIGDSDAARLRAAALRLGVELLKYYDAPDTDRLLSPLSIYIALGMLENGAVGETKAEIDALLGGDREQLNADLTAALAGLPDRDDIRVKLADSVWIKDTPTLRVEEPFLNVMKHTYRASAFRAAFDDSTARDINGWVEEQTDGLIRKMLDKIDADAVMYLINTLLFDAEWAVEYDFDPREAVFTAANGEKRHVKMMYSNEPDYLHDKDTEGFYKLYRGAYRFAALLPKAGTDIDKYVASLTAEKLDALLNSQNGDRVYAGIPQFGYDDDLNLNDALKALGIPTAFDGQKADFTAMATSDDGNISVGRVLHKTHIDLDVKGTRAGAATVIEMKCEAAFEPDTQPVVHDIILDRPFVYLILDPDGVPLFIGTVKDITK